MGVFWVEFGRRENLEGKVYFAVVSAKLLGLCGNGGDKGKRRTLISRGNGQDHE